MPAQNHPDSPLPLPSPQRESGSDPLDSLALKSYVIVAFALLLLAFWLPIQDTITHLIMRLGGDRLLQQTTVPYELRFVSTFLTLLGFPIKAGNAYITWQQALGKNEYIYFTWNCGGWQSFLLFFVTAIVGLWGKYTRFSKGETLLLGLVGTYLFTMLRLMAVLVVYLLVGRPLGIIFHDYLTIFLTFGYLALFWWYAQRFVLKTQQGIAPPLHRQFTRLVFGRGAVALVLTLALLANYLVFFPQVPIAHATSQPTIEQQLNLWDTTAGSGGTAKGIVDIEPSVYSGTVTYYFEVVAKVTSGTGTVTLTYDAGTGTTVSGGSTLTINTINTTSYARYRSSFTPTGGNAYINSITGTGTSVTEARIILVQSDPTSIKNTQTEIEIGDNEPANTATSDTVLNHPKYWTYDATKYDGTVSVYFEAELLNNAAGGTSFASLYPKGASCSGQVTGSEVNMTGTTSTRLRSGDISGNLTTGTTYMVCIRASTGTGTLIKNAKLIMKQTSSGGLTKIEMQHMSVNEPLTQATSTYTSQNKLFQYDPANWAGGTFTYFFESTLNTSAGTGFSQLYNNSDASAVSGSEVTTTSTTDALVRSSSITMPASAKDMDTQIKNSATNTTTVDGSWLVIDVSSLQTPENVLPFLPLVVFLPKFVGMWYRRRRTRCLS